MAHIFCIIDGMTDESTCPAGLYWWHQLEQEGASGLFVTTPAGTVADSVGCILRLLGCSVLDALSLRGWIEALGYGVPFRKQDLILRASWIALDEQQCSVGFCQPSASLPLLKNDIHYYSLGAYKALLVLHDGAWLLTGLHTTAPHQNFGAFLQDLLPQGYAPLTSYLLQNRQERCILIPWGQSCVGALLPFSQQTVWVAGCSTALGIGRALQIPVVRPKQATGDVDTNLTEKIQLVLQMAQTNSLVILHINGADEAGHRKNEGEKQQFLEQVDQIVLSALYQSDHSILVTADHGCSPVTGGHLGNVQPFVLRNRKQKGFLGLRQSAEAIPLLLSCKSLSMEHTL